MNVDESRRDYQPGRVNNGRSVIGDLSYDGDAAVLNSYVRKKSRISGAIDNTAMADDQVVAVRLGNSNEKQRNPEAREPDPPVRSTEAKRRSAGVPTRSNRRSAEASRDTAGGAYFRVAAGGNTRARALRK